MQINYKEITVFLVTLWFFLKKWLAEVDKIVSPLIEQAEQLAKDGKIDKADRKKLVMDAIAMLEHDKKLKLSFLQRLFIGKVVDWLAGKLPDFTISQDTQEAINRAKLMSGQ